MTGLGVGWGRGGRGEAAYFSLFTGTRYRTLRKSTLLILLFLRSLTNIPFVVSFRHTFSSAGCWLGGGNHGERQTKERQEAEKERIVSRSKEKGEEEEEEEEGQEAEVRREIFER
jgi:hypothetical protein